MNAEKFTRVVGVCLQPTFAIYKGSKKVDSFAGARVDLLKEILDKHVGGSSSTAGQ